MPLDITEFRSLKQESNNQTLPVAAEPSILTQQVTIGGASAQSAVFNDDTRIVRLHTDAACRVEFGANPTAAATSRRMGPGQTEYLAVPRGFRVAVITTT